MTGVRHPATIMRSVRQLDSAGGWANQDRGIQCPRSEPMALEVGSRLGHYDVTALIGEGGMGQVYQATDTKLNRQVAWTWGRPDTMRSL